MTIYDPAGDRMMGATRGMTRWTTEYERIYLMTASRIRGEPATAHPRTTTTRATFMRGR